MGKLRTRSFRKPEKTCTKCRETKKVKHFNLPGTYNNPNHDKMCTPCNEDRIAGRKTQSGYNKTSKTGLEIQFNITQKETSYTKEEIEILLDSYLHSEIRKSYKDKNGKIIIKDSFKNTKDEDGNPIIKSNLELKEKNYTI